MEQFLAQSDQKMVKTGFILSAISGVFITVQGILQIVRAQWGLELGLGELRRHALAGVDFKVLGVATLVLGVMVLVGAYLIEGVGRVREGALTVIVFSALTVVTGGGYFFGLILGVIGGALAYSHYFPPDRQKPSQPT